MAYFAVGASSVALRLLPGRAALVSFAYIGSNFLPKTAVTELRAACSALFLDSGAFTAWTKGTPIVIEKYVEHILEHEDRYDAIAALDVIGDWRGSRENWIRMRDAFPSAKTKLIPVFHEGEPIELLDEYVDAPVVGLGRTDGRRNKDASFLFYDACFNRQPTVRFHAFGNGDPQTLEPYPFSSFDCTTWERDSVYANSHRWPWSRVTKETRMRAYIEALESIEHKPAHRPPRSLFDLVQPSAQDPRP